MHGFTPEPYEVLGIVRDATQREVEQPYPSLAMKFHPDRNPEKPEAAERFKKIQQAHEILSGCRKDGLISPTNFYRRSKPPGFFKSEHPFSSFYRALKTHGDRMRKNIKSYRSGGDQAKNDT